MLGVHNIQSKLQLLHVNLPTLLPVLYQKETQLKQSTRPFNHIWLAKCTSLLLILPNSDVSKLKSMKKVRKKPRGVRNGSTGVRNEGIGVRE